MLLFKKIDLSFMKKLLIVSFVTVLLLGTGVSFVDASTKTKKGSLIVSGDYTWATASLTVYYDSSTKKVSGANVDSTYTFLGAKVTEKKVTSLSTYSAKGKLSAKVGSVTKTDTTTVTTK